MHGKAIKAANNHQTMMQSQSAQHAVQAYFGRAKAASLCSTAVICALEENAHTAGYSNRNPTLLFETQMQENSRDAFSLKISLNCISFTLFKWGKQKKQLA